MGISYYNQLRQFRHKYDQIARIITRQTLHDGNAIDGFEQLENVFMLKRIVKELYIMQKQTANRTVKHELIVQRQQVSKSLRYIKL